MDILPFPGGFASTANGWLIFSAASALFYALVLNQPPNLRRTIIKTMAISLLAVVVYDQNGPWLLVAALVLGAVGDAFLAHDGDKAFMGGLAAFLIAHLFYVALFLHDGIGLTVAFAQIWQMVSIIAMAAFTLFMAAQLWQPVARLRLPVMVYIAVIAAMGMTAMTLNRPVALTGAIMFIASDTLLAHEKFLMSENAPWRPLQKFAVWALYYLGQLLIAMAFIV
jgi:uncharacterized membrane protein YhhN